MLYLKVERKVEVERNERHLGLKVFQLLNRNLIMHSPSSKKEISRARERAETTKSLLDSTRQVDDIKVKRDDVVTKRNENNKRKKDTEVYVVHQIGYIHRRREIGLYGGRLQFRYN